MGRTDFPISGMLEISGNVASLVVAKCAEEKPLLKSNVHPLL